MITVTGPLWLWSGTAGSWHFVTVPPEQSDAIRADAIGGPRGFGSVRVQASIDGPSTCSGQAVAWRTSVFPQKSGGYILPVKLEVRRRADISAGDEVTVVIEMI